MTGALAVLDDLIADMGIVPGTTGAQLAQTRDDLRELIEAGNTLIEEWDRQDNGRFDGMTAKAFFAAEARFRAALARVGGAS